MIFPGFSVPGRHKVRVNVVAVVTEKLLPLCHQPGGEDAHDLSPPGVLHLTIPARGTNQTSLLTSLGHLPAVRGEAVVDFVAETCSVESAVFPHVEREVNVILSVAVYLNLVNILHHLHLLPTHIWRL